ncbi:MAG: dTDP-4-dehydrorhamnose reductase [Candidatus Doudnabacteria bacterium]|nr:dTDP-4-dehydrorhamnose reductase [Candidatus Doudnabacteria bacterium]
MKILILGAKGNLGNSLMKTFTDLEPEGWDHADLDVSEEQQVWDKITAYKPDVVFNCAAYNAVDKAEEDRITAETVNGYAPGYIARACKSIDAILFHYSSGMVFPGDNKAGYNEEDIPDPVNSYGRSKLQGEMAVQGNTDKAYIIRTCWLYGEMGPGDSNKKSFSDVMLDKVAKGEEIKVVDDEFGNPTYIKDLSQASRALLETEKPYGIYHIVNTGVASRFDWANEVFKIKNLSVKNEPIKGIALVRMAKRPHYEVLNNTKFIELRPWTEALKEYLK